MHILANSSALLLLALGVAVLAAADWIEEKTASLRARRKQHTPDV